jgi:hypothetical protein
VPEQLLDDADANALLEQQSRGSVPSVMRASIAETCPLEEVLSFLPILPRADRPAIGLREHQIPILSTITGSQTLDRLTSLLELE